MQRAYDMVVHDVAIQKLPVVFCLDRAGLVGEDGPTHHGCYDIAYMRCVPNMVVAAPMNERELRNMMYTAQLDSMNSPISIRYPRGEGVIADLQKDSMAEKYPFEEIQIGKGRKIKDGEGIALLSFGHPGNFAAAAIRDVKAEGINPAHYDMRFAKPLDEALLHEVFAKFNRIITIEDGTVVGGFGTAVLEFMNAHGYTATVKIMGIPDLLVEHGSPKQLYDEIGIDANGIAEVLREMSTISVEQLVK
jgi:1-deoxy-D-xylulose-5-phosphate synthase